MGCKSSKEGENADEIKYEMKHVNVTDADNFFTEASNVLKAMEEMRAAFDETRAKMNELARTDELKEPSLKEAFRVFFWSVSAHRGGKIMDADLSFSEDPIAFKVECGNMDHNTWEFSNAAKELIAGITSAPKQIQELAEKLQGLPEGAQKAVESTKNSGLSGMDAVKAGANAGVNLNTIKNNVPKGQKVIAAVKETLADLKVLIPQIKNLIAEADVVGKKAADAHHLKMTEIFDHYQTAPKKTKEEIDAEKAKGGKGKKPEKSGKKSKEASPEKKAQSPTENKQQAPQTKTEHKEERKSEDPQINEKDGEANKPKHA